MNEYTIRNIVAVLCLAGLLVPITPAPADAADLVHPEFALEVGVVPMNLLVNYDGTVYDQNTFDPGLYTQLDARIVFMDLFWIGGYTKAYTMIRDDAVGFIPYQLLFSFDMGLRYENFTLGFRHFCFHPMKTYTYRQQEWESFPTMGTEGSYEEIFLRIEVR